ncbi:MAG: radical SAM protein [Candidatus Nanoarchaeia archaeon]|nr:radical SAM protein [Candidatus Nanoarchaeia archaeon]
MDVLLLFPPKYDDSNYVLREVGCDQLDPYLRNSTLLASLIGVIKPTKVIDCQIEGKTYEELKGIKTDILVSMNNLSDYKKSSKVFELIEAKKKICIFLPFIPDKKIMEEVKKSYAKDIIFVNDRDVPEVKASNIIYGKKEELTFSELPAPVHSILSVKKSKIPSIEIGRGCPFNCSFCTMARAKVGFKPIDIIIEEMKFFSDNGVKHVDLVDNNFTLNKKRALELCEKIKKQNFKMTWETSTRFELVDGELLKAMKEAGCEQIKYGVESLSDKSMEKNWKNCNLNEMIEKTKLTHDMGIKSVLYLIIGLPGEDGESIKKICRMIEEVKPYRIMVASFKPFPGTLYSKEIFNENESPENMINFYQKSLLEPVDFNYINSEQIKNYRDAIMKSFIKMKLKTRDLKFILFAVKKEGFKESLKHIKYLFSF